MFIVIEGIDGAGKSTQAEELANHLSLITDKPAIVLSESGSTALGAQLFDMIRDPALNISKPALAYMIAASRYQLVEQEIIPMLKNGLHVICDRYTPSGMVYGSIDCRLSLGHLRDTFPSVPQVDAVFVIDIRTSVAVERIKAKKKDTFEDVNKSVIEERRQLYLKLAQGYIPHLARQWFVIDGEQDEVKVHQEIMAHLKQLHLDNLTGKL